MADTVTAAEQTALADTLKDPSQGGAAVSGGLLGAGADVPKVLADNPDLAQLLQESVYTQTGQSAKAQALSNPSAVVTSAPTDAAVSNAMNEVDQHANDIATSGPIAPPVGSTSTTDPNAPVLNENGLTNEQQSLFDKQQALADKVYSETEASVRAQVERDIALTQETQKRSTGTSRVQLAKMGALNTTSAGLSYLNDLATSHARELSSIRQKGEEAISLARNAKSAGDLTMLANKLAEVRQNKKDIQDANNTYIDNILKMGEIAKMQQETDAGTFEALLAAGKTVEDLPTGYFDTLDKTRGRAPGQSEGLWNLTKQATDAKTASDDIDMFTKLTAWQEKASPTDTFTYKGKTYYGSNNGLTYQSSEIDKATGDIVSLFVDQKTGNVTTNVQRGVLTPQVDYSVERIKNSDGSESLWYVPKDPTQGRAVPVNGNQIGGAGGVNIGAMQQGYPQGYSWEANKDELMAKGYTAKDFWCLNFIGGLDSRQDFVGSVGNSLQEKAASVEADIGFTGAARKPQIGDYILTNEDSRYGHIALINDIRTDPNTGKQVAVLTESNYKPLTIDYTRTIELDANNLAVNGGKILGFKHSELKPEFTSQSDVGFGLTSHPEGETSNSTVSAAGRNKDSAYLTDAGKLQSDFSAEATVKNFQTQRDGYLNAVSTDLQNATAQDDIALIFSFMKVLDPTSVVREGEFATAQRYTGLLDSLGVKFDKVVNGNLLSDTQRTNILNSLKGRYTTAEKNFDQVYTQYTNRAEQYRIDPEDVVIDYRDPVSSYNAGQASGRPESYTYDDPNDPEIQQAIAAGWGVFQRADGKVEITPP